MIKLENFFSIKHLYPFGLELRPHESHMSFDDIDALDVHELIKAHRLLVVRQARALPASLFIECATKLGSLLPWDFGVVMEMKVHEKPENYLFTNGPVPFHWDGAFHQEPRYLLFHCLESPDPNCGGETLFSNTHFIWEKAKEDVKMDWINKSLRYVTEKKAHYGGEIHVPMVQKHPYTQETILRFAEAVPKSMLNPVDMHIDGLNPEQTEFWLNQLVPLLYHESNCYQHTWERFDVVLADNFSLLHARRAFKQFSPRFLQRIQIL